MQFGSIRDKLVFSVVASLVIFGLSENAHAVVPTLVSAEITGPNTITVVYSIPVISAQADYTNLVLTPGGARAVTGHVGTGTTTITLTFGGAAAQSGTTATMDITGGVANVREFAAPNDPFVTVIGQAVADGQGSGSGTACSADCIPPTLGVTKTGKMIVENGFSYNGNPVNVNSFFTHYPLITAEVGRENIATFKVFDDRGPQSVSHFALGFGLGKGQIFSDSKAIIEWDKSWNGKEALNVIDPENALDNVRVVTYVGSCKATEVFGKDCQIINVYHTFRQPLDFDIVGTYFWDAKRNAANNYFNDGIRVEGESLNTAKQYEVVYQGQPFTITEVDRNVGIDQEGNSWTFDKQWMMMDYIPQAKIDDGITSQGIDRNNVMFNAYIQGQELIAEYFLKTSIEGSLIQSKTVGEAISYDYDDFVSRSNDIMLQKLIENERNRADQRFSENFVVDANDEFNKYLKIHQQYLEEISRN